jgi:DNA-binding MurR/RpiR family transcriptional regulator
MSTETRYREEALASRIAQLSLIDSLYVAIAIRRPEASLESLKTTSEALRTHRVR